MDVNKWFGICAIVSICVGPVLANSHQICSPGVTSLGWTFPKGDIAIEHGNSLEIICVLNEEPANGTNFDQFTFSLANDVQVNRSLITQVNSTSIRLHIDKPDSVPKEIYYCRYNGNLVCMNVVQVAVKPQPVTDFKCLGYNYDNLTCNWTCPENNITTAYRLTFKLRSGSTRFDCPEEIVCLDTINKTKVASCTWSLNTTPQYRPVHKDYQFTLSMTNKFGSSKFNQTYKNLEHVLSSPPENLRVLNTTPSSVFLEWEIPHSMQYRGVHHRIQYQRESEFKLNKTFVLGAILKNQTNATGKVYFNLTGLPVSHALYDIRVSLRAIDALPHDDTLWSKVASYAVRTASTRPGSPPKTNIGSFEIVNSANNMHHRDVFVYWQQIPDEERNGENFTYVVQVEGRPELRPANYTNSYAKFNNLSISERYVFIIRSKNEEGLSINYSTVVVPEQIDRPREPPNLNKREMGTIFDLSWDYPFNLSITDFTIFWCNNDKERPYQCKGKLNWTTVSKDNRNHTQIITEDNSNNNNLNNNRVYQFAISANSWNSSSGMVWAACTIIDNVAVGKMKNVWIKNIDSTSIDIGWKLDCSHRPVTVRGYIVNYCPIASPVQNECKGRQKSLTIEGGSAVEEAKIKDLKPYTTYMLTVALFTQNNTTSLYSDPLFNTTLEGAPSTPVHVETSNVTNSTAVLSWRPPLEMNGKLLDYRVTYWKNIGNSTRLNVSKDETSVRLENLSSFFEYTVEVSACTKTCSLPKSTTFNTTMGRPGKIAMPSLKSLNSSFAVMGWDKPAPTNGPINYYQVRIRKHAKTVTEKIINSTTDRFIVDECNDIDDDQFKFYISVCAFNVDKERVYQGPWSDEFEYNCGSLGSSFIYVFIALAVIAFAGMMFFLFTRLYKHCKIMRDVEVKLPPGLAPVVADHTLVPWTDGKHVDSDVDRDRGVRRDVEIERDDAHPPPDEELLLVEKIVDGCGGHDSSGCSSAHGSIISSLQSATNLSSTPDSGTTETNVTNYDIGNESMEKTSSYVKAGIKNCNGYITSHFY